MYWSTCLGTTVIVIGGERYGEYHKQLCSVHCLVDRENNLLLHSKKGQSYAGLNWWNYWLIMCNFLIKNTAFTELLSTQHSTVNKVLNGDKFSTIAQLKESIKLIRKSKYTRTIWKPTTNTSWIMFAYDTCHRWCGGSLMLDTYGVNQAFQQSKSLRKLLNPLYSIISSTFIHV